MMELSLEGATTKAFVVANNKGGVGKTPAAFYIAQRWAQMGKSVTLIDLDGQCNLSDMVAPGHSETLSIVDVLRGEEIDDALMTQFALPSGVRVRLVRATGELYDLETELSTGLGVMKFYHALTRSSDLGDAVVIDTPPNLGAMTLGAIIAVGMMKGWVIVPTRPDASSVSGIRSIQAKMEEARQIPGCKPTLLGVIATQVRDTKVHEGWLAALRGDDYPPLLGETQLRGGAYADYDLERLYAPVADTIWQRNGGTHEQVAG